MRIRAGHSLAAGLLLALATGCVNVAPQLVRDVAGLYPADTEAAAEARLQELSRRTGIWIFIVTGDPPDQPRMLDEPMGLADERGARAVAILLGPREMVGYGASRASESAGDMTRLSTLDPVPAAGRDSAAYLEVLLDEVEAWAIEMRTPEPVVPGGEQVGPSGAP